MQVRIKERVLLIVVEEHGADGRVAERERVQRLKGLRAPEFRRAPLCAQNEVLAVSTAANTLHSASAQRN